MGRKSREKWRRRQRKPVVRAARVIPKRPPAKERPLVAVLTYIVGSVLFTILAIGCLHQLRDAVRLRGEGRAVTAAVTQVLPRKGYRGYLVRYAFTVAAQVYGYEEWPRFGSDTPVRLGQEGWEQAKATGVVPVVYWPPDPRINAPAVHLPPDRGIGPEVALLAFHSAMAVFGWLGTLVTALRYVQYRRERNTTHATPGDPTGGGGEKCGTNPGDVNRPSVGRAGVRDGLTRDACRRGIDAMTARHRGAVNFPRSGGGW